MNDHRKFEQFDQCSVCCMWVDFNAGPEFAACPSCPFREVFIAQAAERNRRLSHRPNELVGGAD